jgi:hypothetical protein
MVDIVRCISDCRRGFGLYDSFYCTLHIHTVRDYRHHSAVAILHTLLFTVTHALVFSVFTSRILATDLSQSHCDFKSHMKSSYHRVIPLLPFLLNHLRLPSSKLDPILDSSSSLFCSLLGRVFCVTQKQACSPIRYLAMDVLLLHT